MSASWPQIVFGWPAVTVALLLFGLGIATRRWVSALIAFLVALPFLWYLSRFPRLGYGGPLIALSNLASVIALVKHRRFLAVTALVPFLVAVSWLAYTVLTQ